MGFENYKRFFEEVTGKPYDRPLTAPKIEERDKGNNENNKDNDMLNLNKQEEE